MVTMPDIGLEGASSILPQIMYFLFLLFFLYHVRTPDTTENKTAHEQCRARATTSWVQRYTRLPPASRAGSNIIKRVR